MSYPAFGKHLVYGFGPPFVPYFVKPSPQKCFVVLGNA
jgi:hypothetical protein